MCPWPKLVLLDNMMLFNICFLTSHPQLDDFDVAEELFCCLRLKNDVIYTMITLNIFPYSSLPWCDIFVPPSTCPLFLFPSWACPVSLCPISMGARPGLTTVCPHCFRMAGDGNKHWAHLWTAWLVTTPSIIPQGTHYWAISPTLPPRVHASGLPLAHSAHSLF